MLTQNNNESISCVPPSSSSACHSSSSSVRSLSPQKSESVTEEWPEEEESLSSRHEPSSSVEAELLSESDLWETESLSQPQGAVSRDDDSQMAEVGARNRQHIHGKQKRGDKKNPSRNKRRGTHRGEHKNKQGKW